MSSSVANPLRRNAAIIAHVDHGKTTLVDALLHQSGAFRTNERVEQRALDNTDLERERGIPILAKHTAVHYKDLLINIVDTPAHAAEPAAAGRAAQRLFDAIVEQVPPPRGNPDAPLQILVANLDSSEYVGRIAIGRIFNGRVKIGDPVAVCKLNAAVQETRVTKLYAFDGLKRIDIEAAAARDIVCLAGIDDITIGDVIVERARTPEGSQPDTRSLPPL